MGENEFVSVPRQAVNSFRVIVDGYLDAVR
jgi:hypothetical protein